MKIKKFKIIFFNENRILMNEYHLKQQKVNLLLVWWQLSSHYPLIKKWLLRGGGVINIIFLDIFPFFSFRGK